jgi:hypothetical protein
MVSAFGFARLALGLAMPDVPLTVPRWYLPLGGGVWGLGALVAACTLFRGASWAPVFLRVGALAFSAWYWADRLLLVHTDFARATWPAAAGLNALVLGCVFWGLGRLGVHRFFQEHSQ